MEYFYQGMSILKDILLVLSPIIVAIISYKSNKKSKIELQHEIEKSFRRRMQKHLRFS